MASLFATFLVLAFVFASASADTQHSEEKSGEHCEYCVDHESHVDDGEDDPDHHGEHHAHGCGTCHFHAPAFDGQSNLADIHAGEIKFPFLSTGPPSTVMSGLFRPPRI